MSQLPTGRTRGALYSFANPEGGPVRRKAVYTIGETARIARVGVRTACKWLDSGRLRGYRIPGSRDRRVPHDALLQFLRVNALPIPPELEAATGRLLVFGHADSACHPNGWEVITTFEPFATGMALATPSRLSAVLADCARGRGECLTLAALVRSLDERHPDCRLVCLANEDEPDAACLATVFDVVFRKPADPVSVRAVLEGL